MKRLVLAFLAVALLTAMTGCIGAPQADPSNNSDATAGDGEIVYDKEVPHDEGVVRFVDGEAGVVCYAFSQHGGYDGQGGLSCVPLSETNLTEGEDDF